MKKRPKTKKSSTSPKPPPEPRKITPVDKGLFKLLIEIRQHRSSNLERLSKKQDEAEDALNKFRRGDIKYQRLLRAEKQASDRYYAVMDKERNERNKEVQQGQALLRLHGPTPSVIKYIESIAKKYGLIS